MYATNQTSARRPGFTLIELLVVIGILVLLIGILLPAGQLVYRKAILARDKADLLSIAAALDAYKADFQQYPQVVGPGNDTGSHVLCQALFGLGPATGLGGDGADGPGFRVRKTVSSTVDGGAPDTFGGRVYGPYLDPEKYHFDTGGMDVVRLLDRSGNPILYFPSSNPTANIAAATGPVLASAVAYTVTASRPLFNANDNTAVSVNLILSMLGDSDNSGHINNGETAVSSSLPYLLWGQGPDQQWGTADDATNFH